ncbi:MAG: CotH kinase family protein [Mobilitalea sp.]
MKRKINLIVVVLLILSMLATACSSKQKGDSADKDTEKSTINDGEQSSIPTTEYASQIDKTTIMSFAISVDEEEWQGMLDNATAEEYIPADVTINGTMIKNVGIRPKGNSSLSSIARDDTTDRYSFKIKFDEYVDGQTWLGLDKIVLNNNYSDATSMKEYLSYDIMSYIGVDAPLFAYADITVNGSAWGFYLAVEDIDNGYLARVKNDEGELYKPDTMDMGGMQFNINGQKGAADGTTDGTMTPPTITDGNFNGTFPPDMSSYGNDSSVGAAPGVPNQDQTGTDGVQNNAEEPQTDENQSKKNDNQAQIDDSQQGMGFGNQKGNRTMGSDDGVALIYSDDNLDSYSSIFDNSETKTDEEDQKRVVEAIKNLNQGTDLETYVDVDAVLRYLAAHTVVVNLDSYSSNMGHNYYLYENEGKISILPWDYNMAFGGFQSGDASDVVNFPIDTPVSGVDLEDRPLIAKLLEVPEYLEKYHSYLQEIVDGCFSDGKFEQKIEELKTLISDHIKNDASGFYTYEEYEAAVTQLELLGSLRGESIQGQLDGTIGSTTQEQQAEPDKLIDTSSIDMSALGNGGGMGNWNNSYTGGMGNWNGMGGGFGNLPDGMDMNTLQKAMEIIQAAGDNELTEEQVTELHNLGLTDEQIEEFKNMPAQGRDFQRR